MGPVSSRTVKPSTWPMPLTGIGAEMAGARMTLAAIGLVSLAAFVVIELPRLREARLPLLRRALPAQA